MSFGRLERGASPQPISEINMTPLVDVMLVLVVIFIVTAPLLAHSIRLDLPRTAAAQPGATAVPAVSVTLDRMGQLFLDEKLLTQAELSTKLAGVAARQPDTEVQLRADTAVPYGRVLEVIGVAQQAGLRRIGFVAAPPAPESRR